MVSNIRFPSFKKVDLQKANFIKVLVALVVGASLIFIYPIESLALIISIYLFFGVGRATIYFFKQLQKKSRQTKK